MNTELYYATPHLLPVAYDMRTKEEWAQIEKQQKREANRKKAFVYFMYFALWFFVALACAIGEPWCVLFLLVMFI